MGSEPREEIAVSFGEDRRFLRQQPLFEREQSLPRESHLFWEENCFLEREPSLHERAVAFCETDLLMERESSLFGRETCFPGVRVGAFEIYCLCTLLMMKDRAFCFRGLNHHCLNYVVEGDKL